MTKEEKFKIAEGLISSGERIYRACEQAGLNQRDWYKRSSGSESLARRNKLKRMKARRKELAAELEELDSKIRWFNP